MDKKIIVIAGPTASGKTEISLKLAQTFNAEIVSADSMQVYKFMDIGTAKAGKDEQNQVKHHMIDVVLPDNDFNIYRYQKMAKEALDEIFSKNKTAMLVGGTGFYINALINDNDFEESNRDDEYRDEIFLLAKEKGNFYVHDMLKKVDPEQALIVHENNVKKIARALEFFEQTGIKISKHNEKEKEKKSPYNISFINIFCERAELIYRINKRVLQMIKLGLVDEVNWLLDKGYSRNLTSMQGIGYKEIIAYLNGESSLDKAVENIQIATRQYAKRQMTWFRRQTQAGFFDSQDEKSLDRIIEKINKDINRGGI